MTRKQVIDEFISALVSEHGVVPEKDRTLLRSKLSGALTKDSFIELTTTDIDSLVMGDHYEPAEGGGQEYRAAAWLLKKYPNVDKVLNDYCS